MGASNTAVASALDLLYALPERTLELSAKGQLPDPVSLEAPFVPRALLTGIAHRALGEVEEARADFLRAVPGLEAQAAALRQKNDPETLADQLLWLAKAHAGTGRGEEALAEAREAYELIKDAPERSMALLDQAEILTYLSRRDEAVSLLVEVLDSKAGTVTARSLRANPVFSSLRGYPPFEALIEARVAGK